MSASRARQAVKALFSVGGIVHSWETAETFDDALWANVIEALDKFAALLGVPKRALLP